MSDGYKGTQSPESTASELNALQYAIRSLINRTNTATLVTVKAVTNAGGVSPVGFVDVVPMVAQLDGDGNAYPHGVVFNLPYHRLQGGTNAIILDPQVGDIGMAVFADHDISSVKATKKAATPGSMRRFDIADGLYLGGFLNATPVQYVQFVGTTINITSPGTVNVNAPTVNVNAATVANVTAPAINLGAASQSLLSFVTSAFVSLFNGHTHASSGAGVPNQVMGAGHITSTVKGG
jgi:hypothetical protein